jgi:hypothetical protein
MQAQLFHDMSSRAQVEISFWNLTKRPVLDIFIAKKQKQPQQVQPMLIVQLHQLI